MSFALAGVREGFDEKVDGVAAQGADRPWARHFANLSKRLRVRATPAPSLDDDFAIFAAVNASEFAPAHFTAIAGGRLRIAFCWPALFFPLPWLLYRKMYAAAAFAAAIPFALSMVHAPDLAVQLSVLPALSLCAFGRPLYRWSARRQIAEIRASARDEGHARDALRRAGGVSRAGAVIGVGLTVSLLLATRMLALS